MTNKLTRFLDAQNQIYLKALDEISAGQKQSHWMWFVFPQIIGLGSSYNSSFYGIKSSCEAKAYLAHPVLGRHLIEISNTVLQIKDKTASEIFGKPDDIKLQSSMTLFANINGSDPVFQRVLQQFFGGNNDEQTLKILATLNEMKDENDYKI